MKYFKLRLNVSARLFCLGAVFLFFNLNPASADISAGLTGFWNFDENSGDTAIDGSGNGNSGSLSGGVSRVSGKKGQALYFSGADGVVTVPESSGLIVQNGSASVCFWFKNKNLSKTGGLAGKNWSSVYSYGVYYLASAGELRASLRNSGSDMAYGLNIFPALDLWVHACAVFSDTGSGAVIKSFENGQLKKTIANAIRIGNAPGYAFNIGSEGNYKIAIQGELDEVRVYSRALSDPEVLAVYENDKPAPAAPTAPVISNIAVSSISQTGATVSWQTNIASDSQIEYGSTLFYGSLTALDLNKVTAHSLNLSALAAGATYHFRVKSKGEGTAAVSSDNVFVTLGQSAAPSVEPGAEPSPPDGLPDPTVTVPLSLTCCAGRAWHASVNGTAAGDGSLNQPWNLAAALKSPLIKAGDTLWLTGGTYVGSFTSYLNGTESSPIVVRNWNNERVILDGNDGGSDTNAMQVLNVAGKYVWFWGLEITDSNPRRETAIDPRSSAESYWLSMDDVKKRMGVSHFQDGGSGTGCRFINMIVHDAKQGFSLWFDAANAEAYGNIVYNNGYKAPDRGHGHGFYLQNKTGSKWITDNLVFNNYDNNIQVYGSGQVYLNNFYIDGNGLSNAGVVSGTSGGNIVIYGGNNPKNIHVTNNSAYATPGRTSIPNRIGLSSPQAGVDIRNNFFGNFIDINYWDALRFTGNTVVIDKDSKINFSAGRDPRSAPYQWNNNTYYSFPGLWGDLTYTSNFGGLYKSANLSFSAWKAATGFDTSTNYFLNQKPPAPVVSVRPNRYEQGRAHLIIFNYPKFSSVTVDLAGSGLKNGDNYVIKNAQNYFNDKKTVSGTYSSANPAISLEMTGWEAPAVPLGELTVPPATMPEFGMFVILKTGSSVNPANEEPLLLPDTTSPNIPAGLTAVAVSSSQINLSWQAAADPDVSGFITSGLAAYRLYRGSALIAATADVAYSDTGLEAATSYSYAVAAVDENNNASSQSARVSAATRAAVSTASPRQGGSQGSGYSGGGTAGSSSSGAEPVKANLPLTVPKQGSKSTSAAADNISTKADLFLRQTAIISMPTTNQKLYNQLKGKIILRVQSQGQAYYISPRDKKLYYLGRPDDAYVIIRRQGLGITNDNLEKIPVGFWELSGFDSDGDGLADALETAIGTDKNNPDSDGDGYTDKIEIRSGNSALKKNKKSVFNKTLANKLAGQIFLQVQGRGEAWYINPSDGKRYFLSRPLDAFNLMRKFGIGVTNDNYRAMGGK